MAVEENRLARAVSYAVDPRLLVVPVIFIAAAVGSTSWAEAARWTIIALALAVLPLLVFIAYQTRKGSFLDQEVPHQEQRGQIYWLGNMCLLASLLILALWSAPRPLVILILAMLLSGTVAAMLNQRWKVSVHTGAVAGAAVALLALIGPLAWPTLALIPVVGWTRLALGRHTLGQVVVGGVVGSAVTAFVFRLMLQP
jgi:membrane-associated phospholipid phosphatase